MLNTADILLKVNFYCEFYQQFSMFCLLKNFRKYEMSVFAACLLVPSDVADILR